MRRGVLVLVLAVAACKGTVPTTTAPSAGPDAGRARAKPFTCGAKPACPPGHPEGERALVDAIRSESAAGRVTDAAALVACLGDKVRLDVDPGFSSLEPSRDSRSLLAKVDHDALVRVFDAKTWTETLRIDDAAKSASATGGRLVVSHRGGGSTTWDLSRQTPIDSTSSTKGVSAERTAVFWTDQRMLVIQTDATTARIPIDTTEPLTLAELPGSRFLASTDKGRHFVVDLATSAVLREFTSGESVPARAAKDALVLDVGTFTEGFDELFFAPSHAPLFVALTSGPEKPQPLTGPGCAKSVVVALSDDATRVVTRAAEAFCLFELPSRKLLGTLKEPGRVYVSPVRSLVGGTFVGPDVLVAQTFQSVVRLRVGTDRLYDAKPLSKGSSGILPSTRDGSTYSPVTSLVRPPVGRVWVGKMENAATLEEVRADGEVVSSNGALDWGGLVPWRTDPQGDRVIAPSRRFEAIRSCKLAALDTCVDLPLGGTFEVAPDASWAAGPALVDELSWTLPAFAEPRVGALAVVSTTGPTLLVHHAPGFRAARFVSDSELALLGEDGALLDCELSTHTCKRIATNPKNQFVRTSAGHLVVADETTIASVPALGLTARAAHVKPREPSVRMRDQEKLFFETRGLVVHQESSALAVVDARTGARVRELPMDSWAVLAAATTTPRFVSLSRNELAVFDADTGAKPFTRKVAEFSGDVAIDADGARVALVQGDAIRVFEVDSGKELARWRAPATATMRIGISPDGKRIAAVVEQEAWLMDPSAPTRIAKVKLGPVTARASRAPELSLTNGGWLALTYHDGGVRLVSPTALFTLARDTMDDGVWLEGKTGVSMLGTVSSTSRGIGCHAGAWMLPREACLPVLCEAPAP